MSFFSDAYSEAEDQLQDFFGQTLQKYDWPQTVRDKIKVRVTQEGVEISYEPDIEQMIEDLEYGGINRPAKAALRNFSEEADRIVDLIFSTKGADALIDKGIFG